MPDYSKGKIYQIVSHQTDEVYIGSTTQPLSHRMTSHRQKFKLYSEGKYHFVTSFHILKYDDAKIELIEDCPCDRKEQLLKREGELIREHQCVNRCLAGRTYKEWIEDHKQQFAEQRRQYREINKQQISEQRRQYREANKQQIFEKKQQFREANKEKIKEKKRQYWEANKERIKEQRRIRYALRKAQQDSEEKSNDSL